MKQCRRIDADGLFIEDVLLQDDEELTDDLIEAPCPEGFYKPRWDGAQYIEGATQEYIDSLTGVITQPTTDEKLEELALNVNDALLAIMMLSIE